MDIREDLSLKGLHPWKVKLITVDRVNMKTAIELARLIVGIQVVVENLFEKLVRNFLPRFGKRTFDGVCSALSPLFFHVF
ncbi:MAG: hypothetical protein IPJ84_14465 [Bdellovibrionales bacterium]|nr:hypothetical protein [Bdellovibrionales bacterium]